jgi:hypothetical protein
MRGVVGREDPLEDDNWLGQCRVECLQDDLVFFGGSCVQPTLKLFIALVEEVVELHWRLRFLLATHRTSCLL